MRPKFLPFSSWFLAGLALLGVSGLLWHAGSTASTPQRGFQTNDQCQLPIDYRVGAVDHRFRLDPATVRAAAADAVAIWEEATDQRLFTVTGEGGLVIELVYAPQQQAADDRRRAKANLQKAERRFRERKARHEERLNAFEADRAAYQARLSEFRERSANHAKAVGDWNAGRVARTPDRRAELEAERDALSAKQRELDADGEELQRRSDKLNATAEKLQRDLREINRRVEQHNADAAELDGFKLGRYKQTADRRSITVYKVDDRRELTLVLAHELGHALGIGHVRDPAAIMHHEMTAANRDRTALAPDDIAALREVCGL